MREINVTTTDHTQQRAAFCIIAIVYVIAGAVGLIIYQSLPYVFWLRLLISDVLATVVVFVFSCIFRNASVYDPYWSVQPPVILTLYAIGTKLTLVRLLLVIAVWYWGIRLTGNWASVFYGLRHQDWRYTMLKKKTGKLYPVVNLLGIHLFPTLVVYACILPAVFAMQYDAEANAGTVIGFLICVGAATLQLIADRQMHRFQRSKQGGLISTGLWKYSRHPNYLGEILMWWGIALSVVRVLPQYWYLCAGALINTLMFLFVSIPMAEGRQSKKAGYEQYRSRTRMLFPVKKPLLTKK